MVDWRSLIHASTWNRRYQQQQQQQNTSSSDLLYGMHKDLCLFSSLTGKKVDGKKVRCKSQMEIHVID